MTDQSLAHPTEETEEAFRTWVEAAYDTSWLAKAFPAGTIFVPVDQPDSCQRFGIVVEDDE